MAGSSKYDDLHGKFFYWSWTFAVVIDGRTAAIACQRKMWRSGDHV